ncbi:PREDICTED: NACHT, LRR and PYD domains-containing protein 3-like [Nanorana parkeri]|uniref:NACHT, LRR and PYD domains-containing protein 3-like n=1 Tax=Nanorana parkeri TaxID=125878 RepID=UPI0008542333|nr:PREDICTED: NACHT, LRR and PYD domains-containing protein 3-like [Nanorana parkeri]
MGERQQRHRGGKSERQRRHRGRKSELSERQQTHRGGKSELSERQQRHRGGKSELSERQQRHRGRMEEIRGFCSQLSAYPDSSLSMIYEYYSDDLKDILENLDNHALLMQLKFRDVLHAENYRSLKKELGPSSFSTTLLQDVRDRGREAVIGLWKCLYALHKAHPHPNLLSILGEISQTGESLVEQILLDTHGCSLTPELKEIQIKHKQHLMERTEILVEHRPPGTTLEPQRFLINERYVKLVVVSSDQFRERPQNELIQTGERHEECLKKTQSGLEHISPNRLFRWSHQSQCAPHAVMVSGVPGIGKTTLMQKFVYDWVTGKHYQRFAFLFFFRFRDLNRLGEVSLEEMILQQYPYLRSHIGDILKHPESLLFIFDGLDESVHQLDFRSSTLSDPKLRKDYSSILSNLVRQNLLKGCSVLITSRPTRLASVDTGVFQRISDIMGFLHGDRLIYFKYFFGNEELSEKAFHYVQENDTLYTFCYIPSYCWIICTVLSMCFRAQPTITDQLMTSMPKTVTQLFVTFVSNMLANHNQNKDGGHPARELLTSIGWMAEHGVMNHMIVFDERHLDSFSVRNDKHLFSCFMMESGQPPDVDYTFLHLTLQEFFAALVHFMNYNPDTLQETLDDAESYKDGRGEIFLRFLCGLSHSSTRSMLKSHVGKLSNQAARHVITWIQMKMGQEQGYKRDLLNVFYYLHESRNKALVSQCVGSNKVDFSDVPLSPLDCSVLSFILQSCREIEEVNLIRCNVQNEGLKKLVPALLAIRNLNLHQNHLTDISCPDLASGIRNNQTLRTLEVSNNNLEGPHFRDLMVALTMSRIEELRLRDNKLTDISCPDLASGIRNNRTLKRLDLSRNNLEGPHFRDVMEALTTSQIEQLYFVGCQMTDSSCPDLGSGIRNNQILKRLDLSENNLEDYTHKNEYLLKSFKNEYLLKSFKDEYLKRPYCPRAVCVPAWNAAAASRGMFASLKGRFLALHGGTQKPAKSKGALQYLLRSCKNEHLLKSFKNEYLLKSFKDEYLLKPFKDEYLLKPFKNEYLLKSFKNEYLLKSFKNEYLLKSFKNEYLLKSFKNEYLLKSFKDEYLLKSFKNEPAKSKGALQYLLRSCKNEHLLKSFKNEYLLKSFKDEYLLKSFKDEYLLKPFKDEYLLKPFKNEYLLKSFKNEYLLKSFKNEYLLKSFKNEYLLKSFKNEYLLKSFKDEYLLKSFKNEYLLNF